MFRRKVPIAVDGAFYESLSYQVITIPLPLLKFPMTPKKRYQKRKRK
jgi:hypothetical protein